MDILEICGSFIKINGRSEIEVAHFSVAEYFTTRELPEYTPNPHFINKIDAHSLLLKSCLSWISSSPFNEGWYETSAVFDGRFRQQWFLYAVYHWQFHAQICEVNKHDRRWVIEFFTGPAYNGWKNFLLVCPRQWNALSWQRWERDVAFGESWIWLDSPLHQAFSFRLIHIVKELISNGADVNEESGWNGPLLMEAADQEDVEIVKILLDAGAKWDLATRHGSTALHVALEKGNKELVQMLLEKYNERNMSPRVEWRVLFTKDKLARNSKFMESLIDNKSIVLVSTFHWTGLHEAARWGYIDAAKLLIAAAFEINEVDDDDRTALHLALQHRGGEEIVKLLVDEGAERGFRDFFGWRRLDHAVYQQKKKLIYQLLSLMYPQETHSSVPNLI